MLLNYRLLIGAITASSLLSRTDGRAIFCRDDFDPQKDIVNNKGEHWNGSTAQLLEDFHPSTYQSAKPDWLRVMPLGASITRGLKSTPEDGYRKALREHLVSLGHRVNMVGSHTNKDGSMKDGEHEGVAGDRIDQVYNNLDASNTTKPNIYLINAGTNDCQQNYKNMQGTIDRMNDLLTKAWRLSERATIILSTLTPSFNGADKSERVKNLNVEIRSLAKKLRDDGRKIVLADMSDGFLVKGDFGSDGIHPTNDGYKKLAAVWTAAFLRAHEANMLQEPEDNGVPDDSPATRASRLRL